MRKRDARHVKSVVEGLLGKWESGALKKSSAVQKAWYGAVSEKEKHHARPVSLKKGILVVVVENSAWLYKFTMEKAQILERFNDAYTGRIKAKDIRFRVGDLSE